MLTNEFELLGDLLVKKKLVSPEQVQDALDKQRTVRKKLGELLLEMEVLQESQLIHTLSEQIGIQVAREESLHSADLALVKMVPEPFARQNLVLPLKLENDVLEVAMVDPENIAILDSLKKLVDHEIRPFIASRKDLENAVNRCYESMQTSGEVSNLLSGLEFDIKYEEGQPDFDLSQIKKEVDDAPIVRLVNLIMKNALNERATDIHLEPLEDKILVRYRVDGALHDAMTAPRQSMSGIVSRIKIMSKLNIAENRLPQDGRFTIQLPDREVDIRVSVLPSDQGEKIVLRLLDKAFFDFQLTNLGFEGEDLELFEKCIHRPYGLVLISGPTGSGKSTTLYSAMKAIQSSEDNIVTVEDPVEYQLGGITQVAVNDHIGLSFAHVLRHILRQDPDKILIGEIRDRETADIALKFSQTGHLVFSTLHANDSVSTITRLLDLGLAPFIVGSSLILVMAQRLIRRICEECKEVYTPTPKELALLNLDAKDSKRPVYMGKGCAKCHQSGYYSRVGIFEILLVNKQVRKLIFGQADQEQIQQAAMAQHFRPLRQSALKKMFDGVTTVHEVLKNTVQDF